MMVPRSKDRAREEFEQFVGSCADDLLRMGYLVVSDLAAAEDLVQECSGSPDVGTRYARWTIP
jgi:DNA-directed RNA polymerase specialized sigma24 family protein